MRELFKQITWQFRLFQRNNLLTMIAAITAIYSGLIYFLKDLAGVEKFVTLLIYNDPAVIGFIFIGISIILEKDQEVLHALSVTPLNPHLFLISRILTLSTFGFLGALAMVLAAKGFSFNLFHLSVGAFSTCVLFCYLGIFIVSGTTEILHFLLRGVPLLILMSLPLLNYFELANLSFLKLFPVQGGLNLLVNSYAEKPVSSELVFGYISTFVWIPLLYWFVSRLFIVKAVKN